MPYDHLRKQFFLHIPLSTKTRQFKPSFKEFHFNYECDKEEIERYLIMKSE